MLITQFSYLNRWRLLAPEAKFFFMLAGLCAAFAAGHPLVACLVAFLYALLTMIGAGVPVKVYLRTAAPALLFMVAGLFSLALTVSGAELLPRWSAAGLGEAGRVGGRSLAGLAALLFFVFTTPLSDMIALLRRWRAPEVLLDIMVVSYRTIFVFSDAIREMGVAQAARLGHGDFKTTMRSAGLLLANITLQVWRRSLALHQAALARNGDGPLRFLSTEFPGAGRESAFALALGLLLNALVIAVSR